MTAPDSEPAKAARELSPGAVDAVVVAVMAVLVWAISGALATSAALDTDAVNLALAIDRFDLVAHQPHPPGYLGYVLFLRGLDALLPLDPLEVVVFASRLLVVASIGTAYWAGRAIADRGIGLIAAALVATSPLALYYAVDGQTHAGEMAVAAALLWRLAILRDSGSPLRDAAVIGALLALGGSLRPSFALIAAGPVVWIGWRRWRELAVIAAVAAAGTAAWLIPTVVMAGGWETYRAAGDALIGMFARTTSALSADADARMVADNRAAAALWVAMVAAPVLVAAAARAATRGRPDDGARFAMIYALVSAGPAVAFYALVFIAEAGYVLGLVPAAAVAAAAWGGRSRAGRWTMGAVAALQLAAFLAAPTTSGRSVSWIPSVAEIADRQGAAGAVLARVSDGVGETERLLVIADRGPTALYRQLPLLRPGTDVLFVHSEQLAVHDATTLSLSRAGDWIALPGPILLADGPPATLRVAEAYDRIAVGPLYSETLRAALAAQSRCPVPAMDAELSTPKLAAGCFAGAAIEIAGHRFEWGRPRTERVRR